MVHPLVRFFLAIFLAVLALNPSTPIAAEQAPLKYDESWSRACQAYNDGHFAIAFRDLMPFAARGDPQAQFAIAEMLRTGLGTTRNREEALIWYRRAAEQGHSAAQCNLGTSLYNGWGARADPQRAIDWWITAAIKGNARAMYNLATQIARGRYIERDLVRALRLARESSVKGYSGGANLVAIIEKSMTELQIARAKKLTVGDALNFKRRERAAIKSRRRNQK